jgi:hypothetical protein
MSPTAISFIVFACVFGGALAGMALRVVLPEHHRSAETKDLVKSAMALIGTLSALVLGLLVASAKGTFDTQKAELTSLSAGALMLDRVLDHYGPEAKATRGLLHEVVTDFAARIWHGGATPSKRSDTLFDGIENLEPKDDRQRDLKVEAIALAIELGRTRQLMLAQSYSSISTPLMAVVVFWLTINFLSLGLFAQRNAVVTAALFVCALSVAGAIFLILEMDRPYEGLIRISDAPLQNALTHMGQ